MPTRLEQAIRNEELSVKLYSEGTFFDWANTTAFYSSLHYVQHKILPNTFVGKTCTTIPDVQDALSCKGKHEATNIMVQIHLPLIKDKYSFLMNASFTARYINYEVHPEHAKLCQKMLREIKTACI